APRPRRRVRAAGGAVRRAAPRRAPAALEGPARRRRLQRQVGPPQAPLLRQGQPRRLPPPPPAMTTKSVTPRSTRSTRSCFFGSRLRVLRVLRGAMFLALAGPACFVAHSPAK